MPKFKLLLWFCFFILLVFFSGQEGISIEVEDEVLGLNSIRSLGGNLKAKREIALTFDDAPNLFTEELLEILAEYEVPATFFLVGSQVEKYPQIAYQIVAAGHEVGNHSFSHCWSGDDALEVLVEDIERAEKVIYQVTGQIPRYFRPPGGMINEVVKEACGRTGYSIVLWWVDSQDWLLSEEDMVEKVKKETRNGAIILFHNLAVTIKILPQIIEYFRGEGYELVTVSQLLQR